MLILLKRAKLLVNNIDAFNVLAIQTLSIIIHNSAAKFQEI